MQQAGVHNGDGPFCQRSRLGEDGLERLHCGRRPNSAASLSVPWATHDSGPQPNVVEQHTLGLSKLRYGWPLQSNSCNKLQHALAWIGSFRKRGKMVGTKLPNLAKSAKF